MRALYNRLQHLCKKAFYDESCLLYVQVNNFFSVVIVLSILSIILDSVSLLSRFHLIFTTIEYTAVAFFTIEYICRVIGAEKRLSYIFSFYGLIDLISMVPTYFHIANFTVLKSIRALRILRFMRIMRLAKVARFEHVGKSIQNVEHAIIRMNLQIYFLTLLIVVIVLGNLIYIFEHTHPHFQNIPLSMLWVLESILGGSISTVVPETYGGIGVMMVARFIGFILLGFMVHIVGNIAAHMLLGEKIAREEEQG
jgi:voltage-gated potassium channel